LIVSTGKRNRQILDRRRFLQMGAAAAGLSLGSSGSLYANSLTSLAGASPLPLPGKAKRVIFLFMFGGPSQMDLFDYKPELNRHSGEMVDHERRKGKNSESVLLGSPQQFKQYGETGQWCSDAFKHLPQHMDKLAVIKSMYTDSFAHGSAVLQMNSGKIIQGHPALGSWINYGLGSENTELPGFVVMHDPRGGPISGPANWGSGYMPAKFQGTLFRSRGKALLDLSPAPNSFRYGMSREKEGEQIDAITALNAGHLERHGGDEELLARIGCYGLAHQMQVSAREALDLSSEDPKTLEMYGFNDPTVDHPLALAPGVFGRQCLIARRLVERDVRFVQIYHGGGHQQQTWDAHQGVAENLGIHCPETDRPIAALLSDLERSGLLEETLVIWGGEFGRQPVTQQGGDGQTANSEGRDHNPKAFTVWMAGAGIKPGSYGETDELGGEAVVNKHHIRDLHATILHLAGLDHEKLVFPYGGLDRKLTTVIPAEVIRGVLA
jgi:hypothetical protein